LRSKHFTEISKAAILKYYLFPKLNHLFFCEPLQPQMYNTLNQVMGWFLWGKSAEFDENIKTRFRMSTERLQQPLSAGGLGLWNMQMRHTAQLAWLFERCVRPPSLNNKTPTPLYAQAWMEEVTETSRAREHNILSATFQQKVFFCSSILTRAFNSWKWIQKRARVNTPFIVPPNEVLCIRALYEASNTVPPPKLTPSQSKWQQQYGVDFTRIWNRIHSIQCAPQLRSLLWRIYAKCLPIVRGSQPAALCPFCQQPESTLHIFFECTSPQQITNILQPIFISWFGSPQQWSPPSVLPLQANLRNPKLHLHAIATVLRVIWIRRNIAKFEGRTLSPGETRTLFMTEMARVISAKWKHLLLSTLNQTQSCMDHIKQRKAITQFKRTWLIPQFFSINSHNVIVPTSSQ
jgi:hypothetical protein